MKAETSLMIVFLIIILIFFLVKLPECFAVAKFVESNSASSDAEKDTSLADEIYSTIEL